MKGGITSGVIYPRLVSTLARQYDFRSIGGSSAGAIAAAAAAAAQLGVKTGSNPGAFAELEKLPEMLGGTVGNGKDSMLLSLFQPRQRFRRHFALLKAALNAPTMASRILRPVLAAIIRFPLAALIGAIPGAIVIWSSSLAGDIVGLVLLLLGLVIGAVLGALLTLGRDLPGHNFGICSGLETGMGGEPPALSTWLHAYLNQLAGKSPGAPLTFGELNAGKLREGNKDLGKMPDKPVIELAMMTSALNVGRPYRMPFEVRDFYFREPDMREVLPQAVTDWMIGHPRVSKTVIRLNQKLEQRLRAQGYSGDELQGRLQRERLHPLPDSANLPVVLCVRMSLSFPLLLSAVPLYSLDRTFEFEPEEEEKATRVLFSDGGVCSNFPVHFFDGPLPSRPTFGVNLRDFHPQHTRDEDRVWLPKPLHNDQGIKTYIPVLSQAPGFSSVGKFLGSILASMQNWRDQLQIGMPGFRDRIIHISHRENEGGMNLNMDKGIITQLAESGGEAAKCLTSAFGPLGSFPNAWHNHRRIRVRSLLSLLDQQVRSMARQIGGPSNPAWSDIVCNPLIRSYEYSSDAHRKLACEILEDIVALNKKLEASGIDLATGAPRPSPEWRATPKV